MTECMITCACGCGMKFEPTNIHHRYYSGACRARASKQKHSDGKVAGIRALKAGGWSVTIHCHHQPDGLQMGSQVKVEKAE